MNKKGVSFSLICCLCLMGLVQAEEVPSLFDEIKIIQKKDKEQKEEPKVIEKHYYEKEIIREVPEKKGKYEEHLFKELKGKLDKPKKKAEVWRVEGDLIELNRGAIHKVREGDVYKIYGKDGKYKGKMEVGAIADTISIGKSLKKRHNMQESDTAKYIGQRRFWGSGLLYGSNIIGKNALIKKSNYRGYGIYWRILFKKAWGVGLTLTEFTHSVATRFNNAQRGDIPSAWKKYLGRFTPSANERYYYYIEIEQSITFLAPIDLRKYFFHPSWYTCYIGAGGSLFNAEYKMLLEKTEGILVGSDWRYQYGVDRRITEGTKNTIAPIFTFGSEIVLGQYVRLVLSGYYLYGPEIEIDGYKPLTRPVMMTVAVVGTW